MAYVTIPKDLTKVKSKVFAVNPKLKKLRQLLRQYKIEPLKY